MYLLEKCIVYVRERERFNWIMSLFVHLISFLSFYGVSYIVHNRHCIFVLPFFLSFTWSTANLSHFQLQAFFSSAFHSFHSYCLLAVSLFGSRFYLALRPVVDQGTNQYLALYKCITFIEISFKYEYRDSFGCSFFWYYETFHISCSNFMYIFCCLFEN